jgi:hypothetical protein
MSPSNKSAVSCRQKTHANTVASAKAGEAVKRNKRCLQGFVVETGGRLGSVAKQFMGEVVAECDVTEVAKKAAASRMLRADGIEIMFKQASVMATLIQELRNEQHLVADFARNVGAHLRFWLVAYSSTSVLVTSKKHSGCSSCVGLRTLARPSNASTPPSRRRCYTALDILATERQDNRAEMPPWVSALRCQPLQLSEHRAYANALQGPLPLQEKLQTTIAHFLEDHANS